MNVVIVTTFPDPFAGVFWDAYQQAEGPRPSAVFFLREKKFRPAWRAASELLFLFGPIKGLLLIMSRLLSQVLPRRFRGSRLLFRWSDWFEQWQSEVIHTATLNSTDGLSLLRAAEPDILVSVGASEIFKKDVLSVPRIAALNVHNGRLPAYRGVFATFWEAMHRQSEGCVSVHRMVPKVDAGALVGSVSIEFRYPLDFFKVMMKKKEAGGRLLAEVLQKAETTGRIDELQTGIAGNVRGYYRWPSLKDVVIFSWRIRRREDRPRPRNRPQ